LLITGGRVDNRLFVSSRSSPPPGTSVWLHSAGLLTGHGGCRFAFAPAEHVGPHLVVSGRGTVRCGGREYVVKAGDMFCLLPGVEIDYFEDPKHHWRYAWLHLVGSGATDFAAACGFTADRPVRPCAGTPEVAERMESLRQALRRPEAEPYRILALLYGFADRCAANLESSRAPSSKSGRRAALVERARLLMTSSLHSGINVNQLAEALGVSRTTLFLAFREQLDTTPVACLQRARLDRARQLLRSTDRPVAEVAAAAGFGDPRHFMKCFKSSVGATPTEWRRGTGGDSGPQGPDT
jgi:AraC-like DNA-binding protein